jgi:hypothetical protein
VLSNKGKVPCCEPKGAKAQDVSEIETTIKPKRKPQPFLGASCNSESKKSPENWGMACKQNVRHAQFLTSRFATNARNKCPFNPHRQFFNPKRKITCGSSAHATARTSAYAPLGTPTQATTTDGPNQDGAEIPNHKVFHNIFKHISFEDFILSKFSDLYCRTLKSCKCTID